MAKGRSEQRASSVVGRPFVKGQSGNPGGRPKEAHDVKELARQYTGEAILKLAEWMRSDNAKASVAACNVLLDRGWGKAIQAITGEDGGAIKIEVVKFSE
jgi:hypothetical protein